jgi:EAL domain-containing protein (putative c-di-GMP-specific phosphodiesterase class I)
LYSLYVVGAEALARIYDEFGEEISPVDFIPLAEKNGSISQIGKQIFCKTCPFINVKLDMDVVRSYCKEPGNIIPNTVNSFKSMGFKVTAEGIESAAMADAMYNIGCDYLQGFYFSKPLRMGEFLRYLESENKNI